MVEIMKLIIERVDGGFYAYYEDDERFQQTESKRGTRIRTEILARECNLDIVLDDGEHMVFEIKSRNG